jgi:hypothetical protein
MSKFKEGDLVRISNKNHKFSQHDQFYYWMTWDLRIVDGKLIRVGNPFEYFYRDSFLDSDLCLIDPDLEYSYVQI